MKKITTIFIGLLIIFISLLTIGCRNEPQITQIGIEVIEDSFLEYAGTDWSDIVGQINVNRVYSDGSKKSTKYYFLDCSPIFDTNVVVETEYIVTVQQEAFFDYFIITLIPPTVIDIQLSEEYIYVPFGTSIDGIRSLIEITATYDNNSVGILSDYSIGFPENYNSNYDFSNEEITISDKFINYAIKPSFETVLNDIGLEVSNNFEYASVIMPSYEELSPYYQIDAFLVKEYEVTISWGDFDKTIMLAICSDKTNTAYVSIDILNTNLEVDFTDINLTYDIYTAIKDNLGKYPTKSVQTIRNPLQLPYNYNDYAYVLKNIPMYVYTIPTKLMQRVLDSEGNQLQIDDYHGLPKDSASYDLAIIRKNIILGELDDFSAYLRGISEGYGFDGLYAEFTFSPSLTRVHGVYDILRLKCTISDANGLTYGEVFNSVTENEYQELSRKQLRFAPVDIDPDTVLTDGLEFWIDVEICMIDIMF